MSEETGKVMPQEVALDAIKKMGSEFKPSGENIKAVRMKSDFLFQDADGGIVQGSEGDVIFLNKPAEGEEISASVMSGSDFDENYQKA